MEDNATPASFLQQRIDWIAKPNAVRLQQNGINTFDVVLRIDGTYFGREAAERIRDYLADRVTEVVQALQAQPAADHIAVTNGRGQMHVIPTNESHTTQ